MAGVSRPHIFGLHLHQREIRSRSPIMGHCMFIMKPNESYSGGYIDTAPVPGNMSEGFDRNIRVKERYSGTCPVHSLMLNSTIRHGDGTRMSYVVGSSFSDASVFAQGDRIYCVPRL